MEPEFTKPPPTPIFRRSVESPSSRRHARPRGEDAANLARLVRSVEHVRYAISHDLRQPLRSVHGFSELLTQNLAGKLDDESAGYLQRIRCAATRMDRMIDSILSLSRLCMAPMEKESVDLGAIAREVVDEFLAKHPERTIEFSIEDDLVATGDPYMLGVLMRTLLDDVCKSGAGREATEIRVGRRIDLDGTSVYHVSHHGVGQDPSLPEAQYRPFHRLQSCGEPAEGPLALAVAGCAVERHGGRLWHQDALLGGTIYFFTLEG